jgi:hypothetical protein
VRQNQTPHVRQSCGAWEWELGAQVAGK